MVEEEPLWELRASSSPSLDPSSVEADSGTKGNGPRLCLMVFAAAKASSMLSVYVDRIHRATRYTYHAGAGGRATHTLNKAPKQDTWIALYDIFSPKYAHSHMYLFFTQTYRHTHSCIPTARHTIEPKQTVHIGTMAQHTGARTKAHAHTTHCHRYSQTYISVHGGGKNLLSSLSESTQRH